MTEDEVLPMDESIFGDLDEMSLPELPDSVWMRLLANALDPDAPPANPDLIPVDGPGLDTPDDSAALGDDWAPDHSDGTPTPDDPADDDGADLTPSHTPAHHDVGSGLGPDAHGVHDGGVSGDVGFGTHPSPDAHDDPTNGGF